MPELRETFLTKTHRRAKDDRLLESAVEAIAAVAPLPADPEQTMAKLGIRHDGLRYLYNGYRYDRLADAVEYATLMRSRAQPDPGGPFGQSQTFVPPTNEELSLMAMFAIEFDGRSYRFQGFRYDVLADAVAYANLVADRGDA